MSKRAWMIGTILLVVFCILYVIVVETLDEMKEGESDKNIKKINQNISAGDIRAFEDAVRDQNYSVIHSLLQKGVHPNTKDDHERLPIGRAVERGNVDIVKLLVTYKADVNSVNKDGASLMQRAVEAEDVSMVDCLIQLNADLNLPNKKGETVIWNAVKTGNIEIIDRLVRAKVNIQAVNYSGENVMFQRISSNEEQTIKYLVSKGLKVDSRNNENESVAYHSMHDIDKFRALLDSGLNPNLLNASKDPILIRAIRSRYYAAVKELLTHGADPNVKNKYQENALQIAIKHSNLATVQLLLTHGADVNAVDEFGNTALMQAALRQSPSSVSAILATKKVVLDRKNKEGKTALQLATESKNQEVIKLIQSSDK